jgi:GT2 family glycosyltransferase
MKCVTVILLNYNGSRFLRDLFESLSMQTAKDYELVFVDNNSTDNSIQLLKDITSKHPGRRQFPVKLIQNKTNLGYCRGNNVGLENANAKYVVFLNNDTYLSETWLEELVKVMEAHPFVGACQSRLVFPQEGKVQADGWFLDKYGWSKEVFVPNMNSAFSVVPFYVSGASMIVRKSALEKVDGFDSELSYGDFDLCWRLRLLGYNMAIAPGSVCYHYGSVTAKMLVSGAETVFRHDFEVLRVLLKNYSGGRIFRRIPASIVVMFLEAGFLSLRFRDFSYLSSPLKALVRNMRNLRSTLLMRQKIQNHRKISDREIEKKMLNYSAVISRRLVDEI